MVRIDQTSLILAPMLAGLFMSSLGVYAGCVLIAVWNIVSFAFEYLALYVVYKATPKLALPKQSAQVNTLNNFVRVDRVLFFKVQPAASASTTEQSPLIVNAISTRLQRFTSGWRAYIRSKVLLAALALALLYFTVLATADSITTGYAYSQVLVQDDHSNKLSCLGYQ
jgi:hypothetical protein